MIAASLTTVDAPSTSFAPYLLAQTWEATERRIHAEHEIKLSAARKREEFERCQVDIVHWISTWVNTYDPRFISDGCPATLAFSLFPKQIEFLQWLADRERCQENGSVEKSREVGATWLIAAWGVHGLLFRPGFRLGNFSRLLWLAPS